jgi:guanine deaminase
MDGFSICGTLVHAPQCGELEILEDAFVEVYSGGNIVTVLDKRHPDYTSSKEQAKINGALIELADSQYLLPGLVDTHIHAPQWPQLGKALHLPLDQWLQQCTFPLEARYEDVVFADMVYTSLVESLIANGTTTALYFATIHLESTRRLVDICLDLGQRALVGKVAMDNVDQCPDFYRDASTSSGLDDTRALIEYTRGLKGNSMGRVMPVVTPRFIPSCSDDMLSGLATIVDEYDCHVQTHCSESDWQHAYVVERHGRRDTESLERFELLTSKTILAHANFVNEEDMDIIKNSHSGIAHCPLSNFYFSNAVFPARRALDKGLDIGLGTDISGGPNPSLLHNCAMAVTASRALEEGVDAQLSVNERSRPGTRIDFKEAFWMATAGGGRALDLKIGLFEPGYAMDAIVVDTSIKDSDLTVWKEVDGIEDIVQKIIYNGHRSNITSVWVQGDRIK